MSGPNKSQIDPRWPMDDSD